MSLLSWLRNSKGSHVGKPIRNQAAARKRASFRPRLEALEDRWMPSTLIVTNNLDSGAGSLRADIAAAQSGDTIVFAPSLDGKTITLTSGGLVISKNLTIQGPGANQLTISGNHLSGVFTVYGGATVVTDVLSGLTISNGMSSFGGGIENFGTLTVSQCTLSGNSATHDGGGIYNFGTLTVSQSTLNGNTATLEGGGIFFGGYHKATLTNCTLTSNLAEGDLGTYYGVNLGGGGGLFVDSYGGTINGAAATTTLTNCTISRNYSYWGGSGIAVGIGGGYPGPTVVLTNTIVAGNYAPYFSHYPGDSDIEDSLGVMLTMNNCLIGQTNLNVWNGFGDILIRANDPGLGPLQNNGGPTQTMALLPGSPAIGHGNDSLAPATDQRGVARLDVAGETTDIGAFEL